MNKPTLRKRPQPPLVRRLKSLADYRPSITAEDMQKHVLNKQPANPVNVNSISI